MKVLCIFLAVLVGGVAQGAELSKREKIRAFVQIQALKQLAKWEAKKLHPKNTHMRAPEEKKAVSQAYTAVASQYKITAAELQKIVSLGLQGDWPKPKGIEGGTDVTLSPEDKTRGFKMTVWAKQVQGNMSLVKDRAAKGRLAAESREYRWRRQMFAYDGVRLPDKGKYRVTFYCKLIGVRAHGDREPEITFTIARSTERDRQPWRTVQQKGVAPSLLSKKRYVPCVLEYNTRKGGQVQIGVRQRGVRMRVSHAVIEKIE